MYIINSLLVNSQKLNTLYEYNNNNKIYTVSYFTKKKNYMVF